MGDPRRFQLMAELIARNFPDKNTKIADVAGGSGCLQMALKDLGYKHIVTFEPNKRKHYMRKAVVNYKKFSEKDANEFQLVVGMHPDEATDHIVTCGKPFIVCPCCIKPSKFLAGWSCEKRNFTSWCIWLEKMCIRYNRQPTWAKLKMTGKNMVLIGR